MSLELTEAVWKIELSDPASLVGRPTLKVALLALAFHADDEGNVEGIPREVLMSMTGISRSYWNSAMQTLESEEWLERVPPRNQGGPGKHATYLLDARRLREAAGISLRRSVRAS